MFIGAQLYSVRDRCSNEEEIEKTFQEMKSIGYASVQISGFSYEPEKIKEYASKYGLIIGLTHTPLSEILQDTDAVIQKHTTMKASMVGIGFPTGYCEKNGIDTKRLIRDLTPAVSAIKAAGLQFGYHNHNVEFIDAGGYCAMDVLIEETDWNFILDVGWAHVAKKNTVALIQKLTGRIPYIHLKDFALHTDSDRSWWEIVPIGCGEVSFDSILPALERAGTKIAYVEQDNAVEKNSWEQMRRSYQNMKARGWV